MQEINDNGLCFVCGQKNARGLKLTFKEDKEAGLVAGRVTFPPHMQGWEKVVHGGLVSTVLDEVMVKAAAARELKCVTGEISVKFKKPTMVGQEYILQGKVLEIKRRIIFVEGSLAEPGGKITATAAAKLVMVE